MDQKAMGYPNLGLTVAILRALRGHISQAITLAIPAYNKYTPEADEHTILTGTLLYNDVAQATEGELYIRNAIRFARRKTAPDI